MDSTVIRGNSTDTNNPLGPFQATIHFPSRGIFAGNQLPYTYTMDDPSQLKTSSPVPPPVPDRCAHLDKTNWLTTSVPGHGPVIAANSAEPDQFGGSNRQLRCCCRGQRAV